MRDSCGCRPVSCHVQPESCNRDTATADVAQAVLCHGKERETHTLLHLGKPEACEVRELLRPGSPRGDCSRPHSHRQGRLLRPGEPPKLGRTSNCRFGTRGLPGSAQAFPGDVGGLLCPPVCRASCQNHLASWGSVPTSAFQNALIHGHSRLLHCYFVSLSVTLLGSHWAAGRGPPVHPVTQSSQGAVTQAPRLWTPCPSSGMLPQVCLSR